MHHPSSTSRNVCALLLALAATPAFADWRYVEAQRTEAAPLDTFLVARDDAVWAEGLDGVHRVGVGGEATPAIARSTSPNLYLHSPQLGTALPGGGVLLVERYAAFVYVDATGRQRWRLPRDGASFAQTNANGDLWIVDGARLERVRIDGTVAVKVDDPAVSYWGSPNAIAVDPAGDAIMTVAHRVMKIGRNGILRWNLDNYVNVRRIVPMPDGDIALVGNDEAQSGALAVRRLDGRTGSERGLLTLSDVKLSVNHVLPADAGALYVLGRRNGGGEQPAALLRIDGDGRVAWRRDVCTLATGDGYALAVDTDGAAAVACRVGSQARVLRLDRTGAAAGEAALPFANASQAQWRGETLLVAGRPAGYNGRPRIVALDRTLASVASPIADLTHAEPLDLASSYIADDGSTYLLTRATFAYEHAATRTLTRVAPSGERVWTRQLDEPNTTTMPLVVGAGRVCLIDTRETPDVPGTIGYAVSCFAAADGAPLWQRDYDAPTSSAGGVSRLLDDGTLVYVRTVGDSGFEIVRIGGDGAIVGTSGGTGRPAFVAIAANGRVVVPIDYLRQTAALLQFDAQGRQVYAVAASALGSNWLGMNDTQIADDGSVAVLGRLVNTSSIQRSLWLLAPDGTTRWHRDLGGDFGHTEIRRTADAIYVRQLNFPGPIVPDPDVEPNRLLRVDASDGSVRWERASTGRQFSGAISPWGLFMPTPAGDAVLVMESAIDRLRVRRYDGATGAPQLERTLACSVQCSHPAALRMFANGTTIATQLSLEPASGQTAIVSAWNDLIVDRPPTRLDQSGIAGAWWSPYANGEGFVLDYLPDSRTLFMPWFTFSRDGGNDPAGQRWYVVQGQVPANAVEVELPITESTGGAFDAGPATTPAIVGKATLTFTDCDNGTLRYRFDEGRNGGAAGTITLSRLSPATHDCRLADGTTQTRTSAPANGFDARMSGSWFEPATSGQGLQLTVQPGGIFFAPWFTYDPAGTSDDPGRQRWYTVQGSLANARNGVVELPIVQTIGGAFDSVPTNNMYAVGKATITMLACDRAKLDYRFDDNELAAPMRARSGSIDLVKAGGCAP